MTCIPNLTQDASNLIEKLLVFNPAERLDAASALSIPYVSSAAPPQSLVFPPITEYFDFGFEKVSSRQALKHLVAEETASFKRELALHQRRTTMQARVEAPTTVTPAAPSSSARKPVPNPAVEAQSDAVAIEVISTGSKQRSPSSREALVRKQLAAIGFIFFLQCSIYFLRISPSNYPRLLIYQLLIHPPRRKLRSLAHRLQAKSLPVSKASYYSLSN